MHASKAVQKVEKKFIRSDLPEFRAGDTVKVHAKIREGNKERIQVVEGVVIKVQGSGIGRSLTVRKISGGIGVEILYPLHSQKIAKIEVVNYGKVRQSRIFYLRNLTGRAARIKSCDRLGKKVQLGKVVLDKEAVAKEAAEKEAHEAKMREQAEAATAKKAEEAKMAEPASVSADENSDKNKIS